MEFIIIGTLINSIIWGIVVNKIIENKAKCKIVHKNWGIIAKRRRGRNENDVSLCDVMHLLRKYDVFGYA